MPSQQTEDAGNRRRLSCLPCGCILMTTLFLALVISTIPDFFIWKEWKIPLPDGSGSVVYMTRLNKIFCAEYDRKVRLETKHFHGTERWIPYEFNGADCVNIYWYPAAKGNGPYLRFFDNTYEYLVDLKHGKTFVMLREDDGSCNVGELSSNKFKQGWTTDEATGYTIDTIDGHPVRKLDPTIASNPGTYIGRVGWSSDRFVSKKESSEEYIKTIY